MFKNKITAAQMIRWGLVVLALVVVTAYCLTWIEQDKQMEQRRAEIALKEEELAQLQLKASAMEADIEFSKTDAYIERLARDELTYIKDGEILFVTEDFFKNK